MAAKKTAKASKSKKAAPKAEAKSKAKSAKKADDGKKKKKKKKPDDEPKAAKKPKKADKKPKKADKKAEKAPSAKKSKKVEDAAPKPKISIPAASPPPAEPRRSSAPPSRPSQIPRVYDSVRPKTPVAIPKGFASPKDVHLLVVDDEPEVLNLLVPYLKKRGFTVSEAEDGDQALEKILTDRPHVVLLDVMMPGLTGWEISQYVRDREELDGVRIVMATGIGEEMNAATAPLYGADAYIDKPFRLDDVEKAIVDVLARLARGELGRQS